MDDSPRAVLDRFRHAAITQSTDAMRELHTIDAVHEFPFTRPDLPSRLEGRDAIVDWMATLWQANLITYERYRTIAIHDTADPATIVVEQDAIGTSTATGAFELPNIMVLTVHNGQISRLRDYVNILAAEAAIG
jgi:ketosteroid isomerase-like protein